MRLLPIRRKPEVEERASTPLSFQQWLSYFNYNGVFYPINGLRQTLLNNREEIGSDFHGLISGAYRSNGIVFALMLTRHLHFCEVRFQFRQIRGGRPGNLFGTPDLAPLEHPWPGGTTGDLLGRMIQDVDLAGNAYIVRQNGRLSRLRPDWTNILLAPRVPRDTWVAGDPDTEVVGYLYKPGGPGGGQPTLPFLPGEVAHFAPTPDPEATYRGMSWLTPVIREIQADSMMTKHKSKFLEQGATVNLAVKLPATTVDAFNEWMRVIQEGHQGYENAYKMLFLGGGADPVPIGSSLEQMDFKSVQGGGETRLAAAARVPPVLAGFSEGLQGSSLNAGNYQSARRMFADGCMRPLWRNAAGSLARIINVPAGSELWYDDRDIAFLKEDLKDEAAVQQMQAAAIKSLIDAGFQPSAVVDAITADDLSRLADQHTGLTSVQLLPPGVGGNANGNGDNPKVPSQSV